MLTFRISRPVLCAGLCLVSLMSVATADDPQPTPVAGPAALPPADLPPEVAAQTSGGVSTAPPADLPPDVAATSHPAIGAAPASMPLPEGSVIMPGTSYDSGVTYSTPPVPVVAGNGWQGGWSSAYAPGYYYWSHVPYYTYGYPYVAGYTPGIAPTSWNGYWNYSTAYGAPGYTGYWHGWYAGPYWDYATPTWGWHGLGYSTVGWGHGYWHRPLVHAPLRWCARGWW